MIIAISFEGYGSDLLLFPLYYSKEFFYRMGQLSVESPLFIFVSASNQSMSFHDVTTATKTINNIKGK